MTDEPHHIDITSLSSEQRSVSQAAAILGTTFGPAVLADTLELSFERVAPTLDALTRIGLFDETTSGHLRFVDERVREELVDALPSLIAAELHRKAGSAISARFAGERSASLLVLARHAVGAASLDGADAALDAAIAAADAGSASADDLVDVIQGALRKADVLGATPDRRGRALSALAEAFRQNGDLDAAADAADTAYGVAIDSGDVALQADAVLARRHDLDAVLFDGRPDATDIRCVDEALDACIAAGGLPDRVASLAIRGALARYWVDDSDEQERGRMEDLASLATDVARRVGDAELEARSELASIAIRWGPVPDASALVRANELEPALAMSRDPQIRHSARLWRAVDATARFDESGLLGLAHEIASDPVDGTDGWGEWYAERWRAMAALFRGDLSGVKRHAARARDVGATIAPGHELVPFAPLLMVRRYLEGRLQELAPSSGMTLEVTGGLSSWSAAVMLAVAESGDTDRAGRGLQMLLDRSTPKNMTYLTGNHLLALIARAVDDAEAAEVLRARLVPYVDAVTVFGPANATLGPTSLAVGALEMTLGRPQHAADVFSRAAELSSGTPFAVMAQAERAVALAAAHKPVSREHVDDIRDIAGRMGCNGGVDRILRGLEDTPPRRSAPPRVPASARIFREGNGWVIDRDGRRSTIQAAVGFEHLAELVRRPETAVHCLELSGASERRSDAEAEVLDAQAIAAFRQRLLELQTELDDSDLRLDPARRERKQLEFDQLTEELGAAVGLGGQPRSIGATVVERARSRVTKALHRLIGRVTEVDTEVGRHLTVTVETGTFCAYRPSRDPSLKLEIDP